MIYVATLIILLLCILGLGIGYFLTKKPFQHRCGMKPEKGCSCDSKTPPCENKILY
ncbi:MAG: hypothetical protein HQL19_00085 [Candidatus Omnitrophica bacterium]|nr:hypothetical protein [Candidatus Omnitrophota bacterium]